MEKILDYIMEYNVSHLVIACQINTKTVIFLWI